MTPREMLKLRWLSMLNYFSNFELISSNLAANCTEWHKKTSATKSSGSRKIGCSDCTVRNWTIQNSHSLQCC